MHAYEWQYWILCNYQDQLISHWLCRLVLGFLITNIIDLEPGDIYNNLYFLFTLDFVFIHYQTTILFIFPGHILFLLHTCISCIYSLLQSCSFPMFTYYYFFFQIPVLLPSTHSLLITILPHLIFSFLPISSSSSQSLNPLPSFPALYLV